jgi:hypothetical protein
MKIKALIGVTALLAGSASLAQTAGDAARECTDKRSASEIIERQIRDWRNSDLGKALTQRDADKQLVLLVSGAEPVADSTTSANYGKSRELAFAKAFLSTQAMFVKARKETIEAETASEFFNAAPSAEEFKLEEAEAQGRLMRLGEKLFTLTEATLDNALREAGVSEADIKKVEPSKKVQLFKDRIARRAVTRAVGAVAGVLPVQNFEATDCNNMAAVAMISVFSEKNLEFARDVRNGKPIKPDDSRKSDVTLSAMVDAEINNNEILDIYGLRRVHDQGGYPSLVSYGQWSFVNDGTTPRSREMKRKAALLQAESNAKAQIATYLGGTAQTALETLTEQVAEEFVKVTREGQDSVSTADILERQLQTMGARAKVDLTGMRELATWTLDHPTIPGITMVGTVIGWSPQFADAINQATGSQRRQAVGSESQATATAPQGQVEVRSSKVKNNAADF